MEHMQIVLYGHSFCPMVRPVRHVLNEVNVPYTYVNIHQNEAARQQVRLLNHGNESVPTLVLPGGQTLTEPSIQELHRALAALGYDVPLRARVSARLPQIIVVVVIALAVLRAFGVF